jgi:uncharacterized protein (TIGR02145 family)
MKHFTKGSTILLFSFCLIPLTYFCRNKPDPIIPVTSDCTSITQTSAFSGGKISSVNESAVILRGVCWDTKENPTVENNKTLDGSGKGSFGSTITGLKPGTMYYLRAYVISENDTSYGGTVSFSTLDFGTVTDVEGNLYKTITIGPQTWMAENLATVRFSDGTAIPLIKEDAVWEGLTKPGYCWYKNDEAAFKIDYGALYNWYTVKTGKLCPGGWHVPTDEEFTILTNHLGGEMTAGGKMKVPDVTFWVDPNTGATNTSGFSALPGGFRYFDGKFFDFGFSGYWWSSTEYVASIAWFRFLYYNESSLFRFNNQMRNGFSIRCIKD